MTKISNPVILDDFSSGMIDQYSVSESLMPRNAVRKSINGVFDNPRGSICGRPGSTLVGNNLGTQVYGLYNFRDAPPGTNHRLITTDAGGTNYYFNGTTFSSTLAGDSAGLKTRFVTFLDRVVRLNGTDGAKSWDGAVATAWLTTGGPLDVGNWPAGTKFANVFNSKIYTAGSDSAPDTLYYCSIPSGGAISWTSGNGSLQINPNDGDSGITGIISTGTVELVFKRNSIYRWDGSSTFANKVIGIGAPSIEAIALHDSGFVYFLGLGKNSIGAFRTTGGYPQKLSKNIDRWFRAIDPVFYSNIAVFVDDDHCYYSVGSVTIDGKTYSNAWFVYTISMQIWHVENRATSFTLFATYINSVGDLTTVGGDTAGNVQTINVGTTDNGAPISGDIDLNSIIVTTRARTKLIPNITAYASYWQGIKLFMKVDTGDHKPIGEMSKTEHHFSSLGFKGKRFYPKLTVTNSTTPWQFDGLEINDIDDQGFYQ